MILQHCTDDTTTLYWWYYNTVLMILQHCTDDTATLYWWYYNTVLMILQHCTDDTTTLYWWYYNTVLMILQHCTDDTATLYWWYYTLYVPVILQHCNTDDTTTLYWWYYNTVLMILQDCTDDTHYSEQRHSHIPFQGDGAVGGGHMVGGFETFWWCIWNLKMLKSSAMVICQHEQRVILMAQQICILAMLIRQPEKYKIHSLKCYRFIAYWKNVRIIMHAVFWAMTGRPSCGPDKGYSKLSKACNHRARLFE